MKIAISADEDSGLDASVDLRFGRAQYFALLNTETMEVSFIINSSANVGSGAGVSAAQLIADKKVTALISGNFGPKAFSALSAAGVKLYSFGGGTIREAVEDFTSGKLIEQKEPTRGAHSGMK